MPRTTRPVKRVHSIGATRAGRMGIAPRKELQMETRGRTVPTLRIEMNGNRFSPASFPTSG
jgi:hypothetical protein